MDLVVHEVEHAEPGETSEHSGAQADQAVVMEIQVRQRGQVGEK